MVRTVQEWTELAKQLRPMKWEETDVAVATKYIMGRLEPLKAKKIEQCGSTGKGTAYSGMSVESRGELIACCSRKF